MDRILPIISWIQSGERGGGRDLIEPSEDCNVDSELFFAYCAVYCRCKKSGCRLRALQDHCEQQNHLVLYGWIFL